MYVNAAEIEFKLFDCKSLKQKRQISWKILDKSRHKFNVAIAETDKQDVLNTLVIGVAVVSSSASHGHLMLQRIIHYLELTEEAQLIAVTWYE